jgi:hypothetical protein
VKTSARVIFALAIGGCAVARDPIPARQTVAFRETVERVERGTSGRNCSEADRQIRIAESDFYYAEHSPRDPKRAKAMARQAQAEADSAVALMRRCK